MRIAEKAITALLTGVVMLPAYAETSLIDHDKLESLYEKHLASGRVAGILEYCEKTELRKILIDEIAGDLTDGAIDSRDKILLNTSVSVLQIIDAHARGVSMGLSLAQPAPAHKEKLCSFAMTFVDKD